MLVIRLQRIGKKHQPSYRVVVAEARSKMAAPPREDLGSYNPALKKLTVKGERAKYWIEKGAQPTTTVWNLLVSSKAIDAQKRSVKSANRVPEKPVEKSAPAAEVPKTE